MLHRRAGVRQGPQRTKFTDRNKITFCGITPGGRPAFHVVPRGRKCGLTCDLTRGATSLVFTNPKGDRITYARFYESAWEPAVKASGVRCTPHDLRHTCASWMIAAQVPLPVIQAHLGHESITTTIAVYGSLDRSSYLQAADAIGKMIDPS